MVERVFLINIANMKKLITRLNMIDIKKHRRSFYMTKEQFHGQL